MSWGRALLPTITPRAKVREIAPGENAVMMATNSIIVILITGLIAGKIMGGGFGSSPQSS